MTIKQLSAGSGLSSNAISLVERGEVTPTVETLCKIASALGVSASSLLQEICPSEVIFTRARDYSRHPLADQSLGALACGITPQAPKDEEDEDETSDYSRQYVLCLNGQIEYEADGRCYTLEPGDSLSFNANILHCCRNPGDHVAVAVIVLYPESESQK
ncbi:MAG: cupin domain-containing protein [Anaerolineae bacterium]